MPRKPETRRPPLTGVDGEVRQLTKADIAGMLPMPWDQIDRLGDTPFMPGGRDQPAMPADREVFDE